MAICSHDGRASLSSSAAVLRRQRMNALGLAAWSVISLACAWCAAAEPREVVVLANTNVPDSVELARHYLQARAIPTNHLCLLDLPAGESLSREAYESQLRDPLLAFLRDRKLIEQMPRDPDTIQPHETAWNTMSSSIRYLVSMYGVPLRIDDTRMNLVAKVIDHLSQANRKNMAAVDSELALLLAPAYNINGSGPNPMFNRVSRDEMGPSAETFLVAARLDGPGPGMVRRMIDDALSAERYGVLGRGYFDGRGLTGGSYSVGDFWIREACERFEREGYECVMDTGDRVWGEAYPMEDAAWYMGWYNDTAVGPFRRADFKFRTGAVAYHLHSGSAGTLRSVTERWAGPLLAKGAAATMGAVSEPFLGYTPQLNLFASRLCEGRTFGESAYMSLGAASWQITVVGDPLYQPFKLPLDEQIANLEKDGQSAEWAYVRKVNQFVREGRFNVAQEYCREKMKGRVSLVLKEKLGDLYAKNDQYAEAGEQYRFVIENAPTAETAVRVGARWLLILRLMGQRDEADRLERDLRQRWKDSPVLPWLDTARP